MENNQPPNLSLFVASLQAPDVALIVLGVVFVLGVVAMIWINDA